MEPESPDVVERITRAYNALFKELTRTARSAAEQYRSESGKLTSKPRSARSSAEHRSENG